MAIQVHLPKINGTFSPHENDVRYECRNASFVRHTRGYIRPRIGKHKLGEITAKLSNYSAYVLQAHHDGEHRISVYLGSNRTLLFSVPRQFFYDF